MQSPLLEYRALPSNYQYIYCRHMRMKIHMITHTHTFNLTKSTHTTAQTRYSTHPQGRISTEPKEVHFWINNSRVPRTHNIARRRETREGQNTGGLGHHRTPKTMMQIKSFIGLANYFRSYVKGFARVTGNLHALTKQNAKWKVEDGLPRRQKEAFEAIKAAIS
jgi:hypothetical protein